MSGVESETTAALEAFGRSLHADSTEAVHEFDDGSQVVYGVRFGRPFCDVRADKWSTWLPIDKATLTATGLNR